MSKKKIFTGSTTMTLKDFHGGSIPSDLILPSAPGTSSRPHDRLAAAAYTPSPNPSAPSPAARADRGPDFLSSPSAIGRHFDEDERKPFDSSSAPRRHPIASVESRPVSASQPSARADAKRPVSSPVVAQHLSPSPGVSTSSAGNAWAARKEAVAHSVVALSGPAAASRFAQASAIEKVSSGRWQTKALDAEEMDRRNEESEDGGLGRMSEIREVSVFGSRSELCHEGRVVGSMHQFSLDEGLERPKLKLVPRTTGLEASETKLLEEKQGQIYATSLMHMEEPQEMVRTVGKMKQGSVGADAVSRPAERPKLNLKPRSQPVEQHDETSEKERKILFGGARPREFVLKERAIDATDNLGIAAQFNRAKPDVLKIESKPEPAASSFNRQVEVVESTPAERRSARNVERKDNPSNQQKGDSSRNSWRNENRRSPKEMEKKPAERLPEQETWRKPETAAGARVMRAASALELAQAFSSSMSDSRVDNRYSNQRVLLPGRPQIPFSRLTDTREIHSASTHRHINGY